MAGVSVRGNSGPKWTVTNEKNEAGERVMVARIGEADAGPVDPGMVAAREARNQFSGMATWVPRKGPRGKITTSAVYMDKSLHVETKAAFNDAMHVIEHRLRSQATTVTNVCNERNLLEARVRVLEADLRDARTEQDTLTLEKRQLIRMLDRAPAKVGGIRLDLRTASDA